MGCKRDLNIVHDDGHDRNFFFNLQMYLWYDHGEMITDRVRDF